MSELQSNHNDFSGAGIEQISRPSATSIELTILPLIWTGNSGSYGDPICLKFVSVSPAQKTYEGFKAAMERGTEIRFLGSKTETGKAKGKTVWHFEAERTDLKFCFEFDHVKAVGITNG